MTAGMTEGATGARLALTGGSGFVGSSVVRRLAPRLPLLDLCHRTPAPELPQVTTRQVDLTSRKAVIEALRQWHATALVNLAAAADVDACEKESGDWSGDAYQANAVLPPLLARACAEAGVRFVHVSTDYVFDGKQGPYREEDLPTSAVNWYGQTKLEGEQAVQRVNPNASIVRISLPYGDAHPRKRDIVRLVRSRLDAGQLFTGAADQRISPTWLGDIAEGLLAIALSGSGGIYHLAGTTILPPFEAGLIVARTFGLDESLVRPGTLAGLTQQGRAPRPGTTALLCGRFEREFGGRLRLTGFAEGVGLLRAMEREARPA